MSGGFLAYWNEHVVAQATTLLTHLVLAALAGIAVLVLARISLGAERRALRRTRAHANARLLVDRLIQFGYLLVAALWVLSIFGVQVTAIAAALGVAGLAVSLAMQDVLKNLVAGLYILLERPFTIGELIEFKTFSGTVETIELRTTALRTGTGQRVIIPNAMLFAEVLVNRSAYGRQLLKMRVVIPHKKDASTGPDVLDTVREAVRTVGIQSEGLAPAVVVESLLAEKVTLRAELWTTDARDAAPRAAWAVRSRLPQAEITVIE